MANVQLVGEWKQWHTDAVNEWAQMVIKNIMNDPERREKLRRKVQIEQSQLSTGNGVSREADAGDR